MRYHGRLLTELKTPTGDWSSDSNLFRIMHALVRSGIHQASKFLEMPAEDRHWLIAYWDTIDAMKSIEISEIESKQKIELAKINSKYRK